MNCELFLERLNGLLDERVPPDSDTQLNAHAWQCPACRETLQNYLQLLQLVDSGLPAAPPQLDRKVAAVATRHAPPFRSNRHWLVAAAVAATLLLATIPLVLNRRGNAPSPPGPAPNDLVVQPPTGPSVGPATRQTPLEETMVLDDYRQLITMLAAQIDVESIDSVDQLASGFRPITTSLGAAVDALRRTLPLKHKPKEREPQADTRPLPWVV
jgi:anti-sigma factor RsiW